MGYIGGAARRWRLAQLIFYIRYPGSHLEEPTRELDQIRQLLLRFGIYSLNRNI